MNVNFKKCEGTQEQRPLEVEITGFGNVVYLRRNIQTIIKDGVEFWSYEEAKMTKEEYELYQKDMAQMDTSVMQELMKQMSVIQLNQEMEAVNREIATEEQMKLLSKIELELELKEV